MTSPPLSLPQDDRDHQRARELAAQREAYGPWRPIPSDDRAPRPRQLEVEFGLRRPVLPAAERFWRTALAGTAVGTTMGRELTAAAFRSFGRRVTNSSSSDGAARLVERYLPMFSTEERAELPLGGRTLDDAGFAHQRLYGSTPHLLECARALPDHVKVREHHLAAVLPAGVTLDGLIRERALFMVDLKSAFEGQLHHPTLVLAGFRAAPSSLFFVDPATRALRPCAIQLLPEPIDGQPNPVFTPAAAPGAWLAAKLLANQAEAAAHSAGFHVTGNYAFAQAVVAMRHSLSARHPLHAFAQPWMAEVLPALAMMRLSDYPVPAWKAAGGPLGGQYWRGFRLDDYHLRRRVESRGVAELDLFPWRDNMLELWDAFERFSRRFVEHVYRDDGAVVADSELQSWAASLHARDRCHLRASCLEAAGGRFTSREALVEVLTTLHFFMTAWHGYDAFHWANFAWIPSTPLDLRLDLPVTLDDIPIDTILAALPHPDSKPAREQRAAILAVRKRWQRSTLTAPASPYDLTGLPGAEPLVRDWFSELAELDRRFAARDQALVAAGHAPAPAATRPSNCAGSMWFG